MKSYENESEQALISPDKSERQTGASPVPTSQPAEAETPLVETLNTISEDEIDVPEEQAPQEKLQRRTTASSSRERLWTAIAFWGVVALGAILRFWDLGAKPLHHDESLHAYFSMQLLHSNIQNWLGCVQGTLSCYRYDPLLHGPFQFHAIAFVYLISGFLGAPDHGINTTTVRIAAALLGTVIVGLPFFLRQYLGKIGAWLACFLLAVSPSMVYFSRFAREDIYMACFTLLFIIAVIQYIRTRKMGWAILSAVSFVLSYATKEATFLSIAVFGSFAGALLVWEIVAPYALKKRASLPPDQGTTRTFSVREKWLRRLLMSSVLLAYFVVIGIPALLFLNLTKIISTYTNASQANLNAAQAVVNSVKDSTVWVLAGLAILLALAVLILLLLEQDTENKPQQRRGLARWVDPRKQRLLDTIVTMPWTHWFFALVIGWTIFMVLFTALFTFMPGIGDGIWQGLFYWITQQTVARGGQPWYYYFMLIPLYEQIGLIFGLVGIINCLLHPTRFRLFMIYWFIGNFFIYSWAGEKMPWLIIHLTMPLMILAAIGLTPIVERLIQLAKDLSARSTMRGEKPVQGEDTRGQELRLAPKAPSAYFGEFIVAMIVIGAIFAEIIIGLAGNTLVTVLCGILVTVLCIGLITIVAVVPLKPPFKTKAGLSAGEAIFGGILALLALMLTLQNMYQLTYPHPADAKSEPLIYVQTTPDINTVMSKVAELDQKYYGGNHEIPIAVTSEASWPFYWYLRDYTCVSYNFTPNYSTAPNNSATCKRYGDAQAYPVVIAAGDEISSMYTQTTPDQYNHREYEMRAQGNQGYMPLPCTMPCQEPTYTGVGLGVWLSWGANPPPGATFNPGRAMMRVWQWWWQRIPIGRGVQSRGDQYAPDDGSFMMALFVRKDLAVAP